jgi:hypothetical protein
MPAVITQLEDSVIEIENPAGSTAVVGGALEYAATVVPIAPGSRQKFDKFSRLTLSGPEGTPCVVTIFNPSPLALDVYLETRTDRFLLFVLGAGQYYGGQVSRDEQLFVVPRLDHAQLATGPDLRFEFVKPPSDDVVVRTTVNWSVGLKNISHKPVRLDFPTRQPFATSIYQLRGILSDKLIWSAVGGNAQELDRINLQPGSIIREEFLWPQVDNNGASVLANSRYLIVTRCLANGLPLETRHTCIIHF